MRTPFLVFLAIFVIVFPAVSQPQDDKLIVPGVRIGKWALTMTIDDLVRINGPSSSPVQWSAAATPNVQRDFWGVDWYDLGFGVVTFDQKRTEVLVAGVAGSAIPYKTDKGITLLESKRGDILKVYGNPTVTLKAKGGTFSLIYDKIGLAFSVDGGGGIRLIQVFRPGTARNVWKF